MPTNRRRLLYVIAVALGVSAVGTVTYIFWQRTNPPNPPAVDLAQVDPEVAEAVIAARAAVIKSPRSASAWGKLGMTLRAHDYGDAANLCFVEAERLNSDEPRWPYLHGLTLLLTDPHAGIAKLRQTVEICQDSPPSPRLRLAEALASVGEYADADEQFQLALRVDRASPRANLGLAQLAFQRGDTKRCLDYLRRVESVHPGRKDVRQLQVQVRTRLGENISEREQRALVEMPDDPPWPDAFVVEVQQLQVGLNMRLGEAFALLEQNRVTEALEALEKTVKIHPRSDRAWLAMGQAHGRLKQYTAAETAFRKVLELQPNSVEAWFQLGLAAYFQKKYGEAIECFQKIIAVKPDHALAHYNIGYCLKETNKPQEAIEAFRAALRCAPDYAPAQKALDELLPQKPK